MEARGVKPLVAEGAGAVGVGERHDDEVAGVHGANVRADGLDHADGLMAHPATALARFQRPVRPQIAAADAGTGHADQGVGRLHQTGVGDALDPDVARAVQDSCAHVEAPFVFGRSKSFSPRKARDGGNRESV
jgi:hypothetical protein